MRLHLVSLPHTRVEPAFCGCAYTNKIRLFCKAMGDRHEILLYAPEGDSVPGATLIPCLTDEERIKTFGADDKNRLPEWPNDVQSLQFNLNAAAALVRNIRSHELILISGGLTHLPIVKALPGNLFCEPFVGYFGTVGGGAWAAFESYSHMHTVYAKNGVNDIRYFDTVISPFCDAEEFPHLNDGNGEYVLFLGRLISRKGPHIALEIAKAVGMPLWIAGAGGRMEGNTLVGQDVRLEGNLKYVGPVDIQARAKLMAGAKALICPTTYFEPGGNIAIEAMLAGTPVITHDSGIFSETVKHGVSGFHFRLLREGVEAVQRCDELSPSVIREHAVKNYSLEAIGPKFDHWFERLSTIFGDGWYAK